MHPAGAPSPEGSSSPLRFCTRCGSGLVGGACTRCGGDARRAAAEARIGATGTGRLALLGAFVALVSALNFYGQHSEELKPEGELPYVFSWVTAIGGAIAYLFFFGIIVAFAAGLPWRETFALRRPTSWLRAAGMIGATVVAMGILSAVVEAIWHAGEEQGVTPDRWVPGHTGAYVANLIVIAGMAPVVEELWFRGLAFSLLRRYGEWLAIAATGVSFGLIHGLLVGLPILIPFGIALAYIRSRVDSLYPCIILHSFFNAFALLAVVFT